MGVNFVIGDITTQQVDAIVNVINNEAEDGGNLNHAIHKVAGPELIEYLGYFAVTNHPQYAQFFNADSFGLKISRWNNVPIFSPFAEAKPQNLNTKKITAMKLVEAILAGQVEKVICNGNHTDDWIHDEETGNLMDEWDLMDFANQIFTSESRMSKRVTF